MTTTKDPITLDAHFLDEVGLGALCPADASSLLAHCYEALELRVGSQLAAEMSDEELDEFERLIDADDDAGAMAWLEQHIPQYPEIVHEEFLLLTAELTAASRACLDQLAQEAP